MTSAQLCPSIRNNLDADFLFYLGMSQLQANQKAEARGVLNQALVAGLQEPHATEAKRAPGRSPAGVKRHLGHAPGRKTRSTPFRMLRGLRLPRWRTPV